MKKTAILALVASMALAARAQQNVMRVYDKSGNVTTFAVDDIDFIDFDELHSEPVGTNLGGASNCYVVSRAGSYHFAATHVDGTPIEGIDRATWLWREKSGGELVTDVSYANGRVTFEANGQEGNAVIAALSADGTIVWIWHIWCTDRPQDVAMGATTIMDRHLGAVSSDPDDGRDTWGLVYQYGRNVPFYFIGDNQEYLPQESFDQANRFTEVNPEFDGMRWHTEAYSRNLGYTIEESMDMPLTHLLHSVSPGEKSGYHWVDDRNLDQYVWGSRSVRTKTNYDPCPPGYKVPFHDQLDFTGMEYTPNPSFDMKHPIPGFHLGGAWWPLNTGRHYEDGCALYGGEAVEYCDRLFLWTAYADDYQDNVFTHYSYCPIRVVIENNYKDGQLRVTNPALGAGAFGHAVRCVRESAAVAAPHPVVKPGQMAADFTLVLPDGTERQLSSVVGQTERTLLFFNNPDCPGCRDMLAALDHSPALRARLADGSLHIVSVYTDDNPDLWRSHVADYPAAWTVARDASQAVLTEGLYDMSRTPALYLVDSHGRVLLADTDLTAVEALVK